MICDTCSQPHVTTTLRESGHTTCHACYQDALAHGHYHGMHQDQDGEPELVADCPSCNGSTPTQYKVI